MPRSSTRRFLIASSLARLLRKERGVEGRVVEGHFPARARRMHFVSFEPGQAHLVLNNTGAEGEDSAEERVEVPHPHAEALLEVCAGKVGFERTRLRLGAGSRLLLQHFIHPATLDLLTVVVDDEGEHGPGEFAAPAWFGPEVTHDPAWERRSIALQGAPAVPDVPLSNAALDALLSDLEDNLRVE